jgi:hypothetical protein
MSCCGSPRPAFDARPLAPGALPPAGAALAAPGQPLFQYHGSSTLVVTGPVTGRRYHFAAPGAQLRVDRHDAASLLHVPVLRPVRG